MMKKLIMIQKRENLNTVFVTDEKSNGDANHEYSIDIQEGNSVYNLYFQKGARKDPNSTYGIMNEDLLEIVRHRLQCFQAGEFSCRENAIALTHIEEALLWLNKRVEDRIERNILGTMQK